MESNSESNIKLFSQYHVLPRALAPYITDMSEDGVYTIKNFPKAVFDRLSSGNYFKEEGEESNPISSHLRIIPTSNLENDQTLTIEELVNKQFGIQNHEWQTELTSYINKHTHKTTVAVAETNSSTNRKFDIGLYTVKIENLPEGWNVPDLRKFLFDHDSRFFEKVNVPKDAQGNPRSVAYVKFKHLRYALIFIEKYRNLKTNDFMILNSTLVQ